MSDYQQVSESGIVASAVGLLYPYIAAFSMYLMLSHTTPGGGFHGGSMFAALFIIRVLGLSVKDLHVSRLYAMEKILVVFISLIPIVAIFSNIMPRNYFWMSRYLMVQEVLIGINVGIGFTIAVFRFVFYTQES